MFSSNFVIRLVEIENRQFSQPRVSNAPAEVVPLEFDIGGGVGNNWKDGVIRWSNKFYDGFSRLDTIPECDGRTDR